MKTELHRAFMVSAILTLAMLNSELSNVYAQGTAFTYQGQLNNSGLPANGSYDLTFALYSTNAAGTAIAGPVTNSAIAVNNGLFSTAIDFGSVFAGTNVWLQIAVSTNGANRFTVLTPRQAITPTPYAEFASLASNLSGTVSAAQISGAVASANLSGTYGSAVTFTNAGDSFSGNGANLTSLNASAFSSGTVPAAQLPSSVPTSVTATSANGLTNNISLSGNMLSISIGQTNLWPNTNAMGGGIVNAAIPYTTCFTNASFTFSLPINVQANGYNQPVIDVTNSSGSLITIMPQAEWHALLGTWNCTNESMVSIYIRPGGFTNAICTPLW